ncbi:MAG: hypothetical protein QOJ22_293 [Thermoleophilaceae bacterium]|jgi:hypothetical protein|nr:hypothetical protein [Thermoleophilaceae bacterium]
MKTLEDVLEEIVPTPDPDFVADMERRMQLGFPQETRRPRLAWLTLPALRPRVALAAVVASAMLALLVTVSLVTRDDGRPADEVAVTPEFQPESDAGGASGGAERRRAPAARKDDRLLYAPGESSAGTSPPTGEDVAPQAGNRRVERTAELTLASDPGDFDALADSIFRIADRRHGFVLRSSFTQAGEGLSGGSFELRVPTPQLQPALNELSRLATVRARSESGNDVTASFVSLRDRLRTARAERTSLLRRLEQAFTDTAVGALRRRLAIVGREIAGLRSQLRGARERTDFATVLVTLVDEDTGGAATGETDEAVDDAVGTLEDVLNFLIRAFGVLIPVALTALVVRLVASWARKRARERALA